MSGNVSGEFDRDAILRNLNDDKVETFYWTIIFLGVLCGLGVIGNLHVLFIYLKMHSTNSQIFICSLALIDLVSCSICIPFNIAMCTYPLMYYNDASCKMFKYLGGCVLIGSGALLLAIAVERYRKICKPMSPQFSLKHAKIVCIVVLVGTVLFSTHVFLLYGSTEVSTKHPNVTAYECYIKADLQGTIYRQIHVGVIFTGSLGSCTALTVLYILIGVKIWTHQAKMRKYINGVPSEGTDQSERKQIQIMTTGDNSDTEDVESNQTETSEQETSFTSSSNSTNQNDHRKQSLVDRKAEKFNRMKRTTYMFIWISLFCILSFIPYPVLRIYQFFNQDWYDNLSVSELNGLNVALSTFYINNVVNFFVYIVCDSIFRQELISFYSKIFCRK